ncbi:hypothetical protein [Anthocerotibacter panamensis]|uniref:hypothetical protein n=1 Tax=Anthocerotibacter panamensis TaxID=2857077 RepID=UPI001C406D74|nr:hypothetical protein [Anthocerotibacter panamensis]
MLDPRSISRPVYTALNTIATQAANDQGRRDEQYGQAVELYTYLATWGLIRLKAEENALGQEGKKQVVQRFFSVLQEVSHTQGLAEAGGVQVLLGMNSSQYLGLTGLGLQVAREFAFWAGAIY